MLHENLKGRIAVVTGGGGVLCGSFAKTLAKQGCKVAVLDLNEEAAKKCADEIIADGGEAVAVKCNVLDLKSMQQARDTIKELLGGTCDILLNGAGGNNPKGTTKVGRENLYLTTRDYALEFGLLNEYKIYDNLQVNLEASYIALWLDKSDDVWGQSLTGGDHRDIRDAWNVSVLFIYSF